MTKLAFRPCSNHVRLSACYVTLVVFLFACGSQTPLRQAPTADVLPAVTALQDGDFREAQRRATELLTGARSSRASAVLAIAKYEYTVQRLVDEASAVLEEADDIERFDHARMRNVLASTEQSLSEIDGHLKDALSDPEFSLELCVACWQRDWNGDGEINERDQRLLEVEFAADGSEIEVGDPRRRPTFRFDVGDLHWGRAMLAFQRAGLNLVLAYDWAELDKVFELSLFGKAPDIEIRIKLLHASKVKHARDLILAGLEHSDSEREAYLAETDDDREWVPNPNQRNSGVPLRVDVDLYRTWEGVVADLRRLVAGDTGISLGEVARSANLPFVPTGYLDVGSMLSHPKDLVLNMRAMEKHADGAEMNPDAFMRELFGSFYVEKMQPSKLVGRLTRMAGELTRGEDTLDRKLRYLFWIN